MNQPVWSGASRTRPAREAGHTEPANLADILERVLDKGIVIAGDIRIDLLDIELLTIKIRLIVASVDRAREMGIDWWEHDPTLSYGDRDVLEENRRLRRRIGDLEAERSDEPAAAPEGRGGRRAAIDDDARTPDAAGDAGPGSGRGAGRASGRSSRRADGDRDAGARGTAGRSRSRRRDGDAP